MYNLRYHIASLVGVFLALALGLILGGLVVQRGAVDRQQDSLVDGLRKEFAALRTENQQLTAENTMVEGFASDMSVAWTVDRLVGKNVVVVSSAGRTEGTGDVTEAIEGAGGTVISVTLLQEDLGMQDQEIRSLVTSDSFSAEVLASVAASLSAEWLTPSVDQPLTHALRSAGVLSIEGLEPGMAAIGLVDIAQAEGGPDSTGLALAAHFRQAGGIAVAGEAAASTAGLASAAWGREIAGFNTLGTPIGRYTLVALLSGAKPGLFGTTDTASAHYPKLPK